jgi:uncharacterized protein
MRRLLALAALALVAAAAPAADPPVPVPRGFVNDLAHVLPPPTVARLTALLEELRAKTGAEIAVLTVETTAPLDDFSYAMRVAEAWKPGRKGEDTGVVFLVATRDRKLRILVGYGLEGILPDGLVGEIQDRDIVPAFRAGRFDEGIAKGVEVLAAYIAKSRGVTLTGVPPPPPRARPAEPPTWLVAFVVLVLIGLVLYQASRPPGVGRRRRGGVFLPPFGGDFGGGFGGGGGGFGGFGGGSFGGGGAGRSW